MPTKNRFAFLSIFLIGLSLCAIYSNNLKSRFGINCKPSDLTGEVDTSEKTAYYNGEEVNLPEVALNNLSKKQDVLGTSTEERWIDVDLSEQKIRAWEGGSLFLEAPISSGLPGFSTPKGEFRVMYKVRATKMEGGVGKYYYNLPNVPFVMFFGNDKLFWGKGFGLHGAYWHNDFGKVHSHGCVNLQIPVAEKLYYWTLPVVPEGKNFVRADDSHPGTRIVIHE